MRIPDSISECMEVLESHGYEAFLVGGCVRDELMGKTPHDYDMTTNASPDEMLECFKAYRVIPTGIKHGTLTVLCRGEQVEITTYRIDGKYSDNRHPECVTFTRELSEDLSRRDFTVNAMAYNPKTGVVDIFDGMKHLHDGKIVCVGNPDLRFNEDGLRIMRALRFSAVLGFEIAPETSESIRKNRELLKNIAVERIYTELSKLLIGCDACRIVTGYPEVFRVFMPEFGCDKDAVETAGRIIDRLNKTGRDARLAVTAMLFASGVNADSAGRLMKRLKTDRNSIELVTKLTEDIRREIPCDEKAIRRFFKNKTYEYAELLTKFRVAAEISLYDREILRITKDIYDSGFCLSLKQLKINGADLYEMGVPKGRAMGDILDKLLDSVIDGKLKNNEVELKAAVAAYLLR